MNKRDGSNGLIDLWLAMWHDTASYRNIRLYVLLLLAPAMMMIQGGMVQGAFGALWGGLGFVLFLVWFAPLVKNFSR